MSEVVLAQDGQAALLAQIVAALNALAGPGAPQVGVFSVNVVPQFNTVAGDLPSETLNSVVDQSITTLSAPYLTAEGQWETSVSTILTWTAASGDVGKTIYGYKLVIPSGTLVYAERFDNPIIMSAAGQQLDVLVRFQLASLAGSGAI